MDELADALNDVARRTRDHAETLETEEATKNAIVMPFISNVLGYDVFNPAEVVPEFVADVGLKRGEKIDYAIIRDGRVNMLIEAKKIGSDLSLANANQLVRYFHTSDARIGVLTNGRVWQFYTDLDKPNIMDERPFLILDLLSIDPAALPHLQQMCKSTFDLESVLEVAEELKYVSAIKREIADEFAQPSDEFVRMLAKRTYHGYLQAKVVERFTSIVSKAAKQYVSDRVNERLKNALSGSDSDDRAAVAPVPVVLPSTSAQASHPEMQAEVEHPVDARILDVVTTEEELEAFRIVRAIVASDVPAGRVSLRDAKSYCAILLDDNNRKPITRLFFDRRVKQIGIFDQEKNIERVDVGSLEDIYLHADALRETIRRYL